MPKYGVTMYVLLSKQCKSEREKKMKKMPVVRLKSKKQVIPITSLEQGAVSKELWYPTSSLFTLETLNFCSVHSTLVQ